MSCEPQLRRAGAEPVVVDARSSDGAELFCAALAPAIPLRPMHAVLAHPHRVPSRVDDVRAALGERARQPRLPDVGRDRGEIEVVVAGVDAGRRIHGPYFGLRVGAAATSLIFAIGRPAVVPPSTGSTIPVTCAERSLARYSTAFATSLRRSRRAGAAA